MKNRRRRRRLSLFVMEIRNINLAGKRNFVFTDVAASEENGVRPLYFLFHRQAVTFFATSMEEPSTEAFIFRRA